MVTANITVWDAQSVPTISVFARSSHAVEFAIIVSLREAKRLPLYIVPSYNRRWGAREIHVWDVYNWQHWWDRSPVKLNPIHIAPTEQVMGAQISVWESTYEEEITKVLENLPTLSERTWNVVRVQRIEEFLDKLKNSVHRIARLIEDD